MGDRATVLDWIEPVGQRWKKWLFQLGVGLLIANAPVGYGGLAVAGVMYLKTGAVFWVKLGSLLYAFSWVMLAVGVGLAGSESLRRIDRWWRQLLSRRDKCVAD